MRSLRTDSASARAYSVSLKDGWLAAHLLQCCTSCISDRFLVEVVLCVHTDSMTAGQLFWHWLQWPAPQASLMLVSLGLSDGDNVNTTPGTGAR
jgi:hypothetical protein